MDPVGGRRRRAAAESESASGGGCIRSCTNVARGRPLSDTRSKKRKRTAPPAVSVPLLPEEIVMEILARLPVKSLLRFKSVCRGWRAMISEPSFIRTQLQRSASRRKQEPSILISPHIGHHPHAISLQDDWPSKLSTHISFYQWEHRGATSLARLMDARDFPAGEFRLICYFTHCDGLVLAPTNTSSTSSTRQQERPSHCLTATATTMLQGWGWILVPASTRWFGPSTAPWIPSPWGWRCSPSVNPTHVGGRPPLILHTPSLDGGPPLLSRVATCSGTWTGVATPMLLGDSSALAYKMRRSPSPVFRTRWTRRSTRTSCRTCCTGSYASYMFWSTMGC